VRIAFYGWSLEREGACKGLLRRHPVGLDFTRKAQKSPGGLQGVDVNLLLDWRFRKISFNPLNNLMR